MGKGTFPESFRRREQEAQGITRLDAQASYNAIKVDKADASAERDELEEYLASPDETDFEMDLLKYWKESEYKWPALAKMAKQYLAAPASSAGVERVFSTAGKMHDDLRKAMKDDSLKHSLFAAFNTKCSDLEVTTLRLAE